VHDYFEILGVAPDAHAMDIRRACARRASRPQPDFLEPGRQPGPPLQLADVAVDFLDMSDIVERMRVAFFRARG
jgi:hypothetical protein